MNAQELLKSIEADEHSHISFLQRFVQAPSPNPPGDTREAAQVLVDYLKSHGIDPEIIAVEEHMPNVVSDFTCGNASGNRLIMVCVLNRPEPSSSPCRFLHKSSSFRHVNALYILSL
jgi:succinyl-diaminopimelate desuccinylase